MGPCTEKRRSTRRVGAPSLPSHLFNDPITAGQHPVPILNSRTGRPFEGKWGFGIMGSDGGPSRSMANTILVVDDEKNIVQLARLYLANDGFHVEEAHDGK